jgi:hypothetical protein
LANPYPLEDRSTVLSEKFALPSVSDNREFYSEEAIPTINPYRKPNVLGKR